MSFGMSVKSPTGQEMVSGYSITNIVEIVPIKRGWQTITLPALQPGQWYSFAMSNGVAPSVPLDYAARFNTISLSGNILRYEGINTSTDLGSDRYSGIWDNCGIIIYGGRS